MGSARSWSVFAGCIAILLGGLAVSSESKTARGKRVSPAELRSAPLTIAMSATGDFARGEEWFLSVNSAGEAQLTIGRVPRAATRNFAVSEDQLGILRTALAEHEFFELEADAYGQLVPDSGMQTLTITVGSTTKSVTLHFLMNWVAAKDKEKLRDPARAVAVAMMIRDWFNDANAVDLREYDKKVIDAAAE